MLPENIVRYFSKANDFVIPSSEIDQESDELECLINDLRCETNQKTSNDNRLCIS